MEMSLLRAAIPALACLWSAHAQAAAPQLELSWFTELPAMSGMTLSPDGRYIAYIGRRGETPAVYTRDLENPDAPAHIVITNSSADPASINWCRWANSQRLLCSVQLSYSTLKSMRTLHLNETVSVLSGMPRNEWRTTTPTAAGGQAEDAAITVGGASSETRDRGAVEDSIKGNSFETRLVSVSVNGDNLIEMGAKDTGEALVQDRVIDWTPDDPDSVIITLDDNLDGFPSIEKLDVATGKLTTVEYPLVGVTRYFSDSRGNVRLAQGKSDRSFFYVARRNGETRWRLVAVYRLDGMRDALKPDSIEPGTNRVLAFGSVDGRRTLFEADLENPKAKPKVLASRPDRDILSALYATDGRYIGYSYIDERMHYEYTDAKARKAVNIATRQLPSDVSLRIADMTPDSKVYLLEATSDVDAGSFYLLDMRKSEAELRLIGNARPELDSPMPRVKTISYKAADGSEVQGFLTLPLDTAPTKLPMVVMPHAFTSGVDFAQFDYLRLFLASRGYAVLQMNFRGSWGYGQKWLSAGQGNWGGVAHSDIVDGARWAIAQGIADPDRLAIAGYGMGGYQALLGGYRDKNLFKAVISIGGISDLGDEKDLMDSTSEALIGTKWLQMRRDSPVHHADDITAPVLLIHGELDMLSEPYQSERMAAVLKGEKKIHSYVPIKTADNRFWQPAERTQILSSVETFLQQHLNDGAPPATATPAPTTSSVTPAAN